MGSAKGVEVRECLDVCVLETWRWASANSFLSSFQPFKSC